MEQYLISEEELIQCIKDWTQQGYIPAYFIKNNYIKSKKPVRLIAEGHIHYFEEEIDIGVGNMPHLEYGFSGLTQEIAKENEGCPAKLFVEEE